MIAQFKTKDVQGRNTLHLVYKYEKAYFHEMRRWVKADEEFKIEYIVLREYKGYKYIANRQCNLPNTWFAICAAIQNLENEEIKA